MEFTRPGDTEKQPVSELYDYEQEILVKTKQNVFRKGIELLLTAVFWLYTFIVTWFFLSAVLNVNDRYIAILKTALNVTNADIRELLFFGLVSSFVAALLLFIWRTYNKRKYGPLNRRQMPKDTTLDDWLALDLMEPEDIHRLQSDKVIVFEKNPVKELK
ncbi:MULTISPECIES: poly-beta-1,6-N-acetyl-D-glucosamine biosynthesis protein PgaD [Exiguobacterium]|jgi:biofilm PGA synthesis protein PgaD|uniref:poly-beta-1,6-N-acetyl-D-glucosamine biosynthesis protein PgaD n=1 Tax=Exiguobacterium TaxID=33986 RepID=UPI001BEC925C|nr:MULTISPECIES: poly-beta-1,6-N-acetyl-D-glucosamine biosynthesis protein PgaD [Exiguobacterium]